MSVTTELIDRIANAIGSAHIGAPWTVNDYPDSHAAKLYRAMAHAAYAASGAGAATMLAGELRTAASNLLASLDSEGTWTGANIGALRVAMKKTPVDMDAELARLRGQLAAAQHSATGRWGDYERALQERDSLRARVSELEEAAEINRT